MNTIKVEVGKQVGIVRSGSWSEGLYTVTKIDKVKIVVVRDSDKYERKFSVKTQRELGAVSFYRASALEEVATQMARTAARDKAAALSAAWQAVEAAVKCKDKQRAVELLAQIADTKEA